jgi:hypothetical protein
MRRMLMRAAAQMTCLGTRALGGSLKGHILKIKCWDKLGLISYPVLRVQQIPRIEHMKATLSVNSVIASDF